MTVLVLARLSAPAVADIRAVLRDWTAAGLVTAPVWVDVDQQLDAQHGVSGFEVTAQGDVRIDVNGWFTRRGLAASGNDVRLVSLQALRTAADVVPAARITALRQRLGLPAVQVLNVLAVAPGTTGLPDEALLDSQRNILLQPVDSEEPAGQAYPVTEPTAWAMHAAVGFATTAGLWSVADQAPTDADHPWAGRQVRLARCYLRHLDGSQVLDGIATAVLDENNGRPYSRTPQGQVFPTVSPDRRVATAEAAAGGLIAGQPVAGYTPLAPPPVPARKQVTPGAALGDFFSFLGGALLRAPGEWVARRIQGFQQGVSSRLTAALYGQDGAYEVVMGNQPGRAPDAAAAADGARWLVSRLSPGSEPPSPDAHALWRGEVTTAIALVDGSASASGQMPMRGTQRLIIGDPAAVSSPPDTPGFRIPAGLLRSQAPLTIAPDDPYTARRVQTELDGIARTTGAWGYGAGGFGGPGQGPAAQAGLIAGDLRQWMHQRRGFTWAVSDQIAQNMLAAQADQAQLWNAATTEEIAQAKQEAQTEAARTKKRMLGWVFGLLLATVLVVVLAVLGVLTGWLLAIIAVVVALGWVIGALATFISSSKRYYQLIHTMDRLAARRAWAEDNMLVVPQAIIRLADVYRRSRQWAALISELVHDPFCRDARTGESAAGRIDLVGTLPYSMALGHLPFDRQTYGEEIFGAAAITLQPGWLDTTEAGRRALALSVRSRQSGVREHEMVWNSDGTENSALAALVAAQREPAFRRAHGDAAMSWLNGKLQAGGLGLKQAQLDAGGNIRAVAAGEFIQQLVQAVPVPHQEGMAPSGVQAGAAEIDRVHLWGAARQPDLGREVRMHPTTPQTGRRLLDRLVVRCDLSAGLPTGQLSYFAASAVNADDEVDLPPTRAWSISDSDPDLPPAPRSRA